MRTGIIDTHTLIMELNCPSMILEVRLRNIFQKVGRESSLINFYVTRYFL